MAPNDNTGTRNPAASSRSPATEGDATITSLSTVRRERQNLPGDDDSAVGQTDAPPVSRRELMRRVALRLGTEPSTTGPVLMAALEELGRALDAGETLALPPLGRMRVVKGSPEEGRQYTIKLRRPKPEDEAGQADEPKPGKRGADADVAQDDDDI